MADKAEPAWKTGKSPIAVKFRKVKEQCPNFLLVVKVGDFYELFYEEAEFATAKLGLTLTTRTKQSEEPVPMAGFPYHQLDAYLRRLVALGVKVAVVDWENLKVVEQAGATIQQLDPGPPGVSPRLLSAAVKVLEDLYGPKLLNSTVEDFRKALAEAEMFYKNFPPDAAKIAKQVKSAAKKEQVKNAVGGC